MEEIYFTPRELDVMSILWRAGSGTVAEVKGELGDELAYTSVLSALQTLEEKGFVRHEAEGRAYRYFATVEPEAAGGEAPSPGSGMRSSTGRRSGCSRSSSRIAGCRARSWSGCGACWPSG